MAHKPIPADKHLAVMKFYAQGTQCHSGHVIWYIRGDCNRKDHLVVVFGMMAIFNP